MKSKTTETLTIEAVGFNTVKVRIKGVSPLIMNCMSEKARRELLLPKGRKTLADRAATLKHEPLQEYRNSVYRHVSDDKPTRLVFPSTAFKKSMASAALRIPGVKKTEIGQLVWVQDATVDIYGIPQLLMSVVRSADINRTPDIRTRAIIPEWTCMLVVNFAVPMVNAKQIGNLLGAAGMLMGIGDGRQEKGAMSFGQFTMANDDDPDVVRLLETGGRVAQDRALADPAPFDHETEQMLAWFASETAKLGRAA